MKKKFFFGLVATCAVIVGAGVYLNSVVVDLPTELHGTWCYRDFDYQPKVRELLHPPDSSHCHSLNPHDIHGRIIFNPDRTIERWHGDPGSSFFWVDKCKPHSVTVKGRAYALSVSCVLSPDRVSTTEKWKMVARPDGTGRIEYEPLVSTAPLGWR